MLSRDDKLIRKRLLAKRRVAAFRARERLARQLVKQGKRRRIDGVPDTELQQPQRSNVDYDQHMPSEPTREIASHSSLDFDGMVKAVTAILAQSRSMSRHDQERIRDVFHAAGSLLSAQTRCAPADQAFFEKELRSAILKQR